MLKNNRILRVLAAVMTVIMVACAFAGCSAVVQDPVVAKVGDVEILYSTFYNAFSTYAQYGIIDTSNSETAKDGRQMIMDMLVNSVVPVAEAHKLGMELTDEEMNEAKENALTAANRYLSQYEDSEIEDETERRENAIKAFDAAYKANGYSFAAILADMEQQYVDEALGQKILNEHYSNIAEPTGEEIQARYDKELAADKEAYEKDPSQYNTDESYYSYYGNLKPLVAPAGLYYVKHILIKNAENADEDKKDRDYKALAQEVLDKVNAGEDFEALMKEYNEDPGMDSKPDGYIVGETFENVYDEAFQKAAAALKKEGDVSGLVEGTYGIHIIKRYKDVSTDVVPLEDVKDDIKNLIMSEKKDEMYDQLMEQWKSELDVVTYDKRVQYVGVNQ